MPTTRLEASSLLHYNADFRVLICRECQYAIQKSAVDSHLLKHKIYRGDRQKLLAEIAQLELLEPADVVPPSPNSSAIEALPVLQGYRCNIAGCRHLTASEKRAKRHWSEVHGFGESLPPIREFTHSVNLQTFFRGTRVRYFEVSPSADKKVSGNDDKDCFDHVHRSEFDGGYHGHTGETSTTDTNCSISDSQISNPRPSGSANPQPSIELDMDTIKYFHHFIAFTAPTLPGSCDYWQTKVASEALPHKWVMCGLLAISICHLMVLNTDLSNIQSHTERQAIYSREFFRTFNYNAKLATKQDVAELKDQSRVFVDQIAGLLQCAQWAAEETSIDKSMQRALQIEIVLDSMRACSIRKPSSSTTKPGSQVDQNNTERTIRPDEVSHSAEDPTLSVLLNCIRKLPLHMAEVLGKPDSAEDLFATLAAITALVESCELSFPSTRLDIVWEGASEWLTKVSARFNAMVVRHDPAALIVLAHWAAILVKRAEHLGCWFLKGASKMIRLQIVNQLSATNPAALRLVDRLMTDFND